MNMLDQNRPKGKTLVWVGGIHVFVLLVAFLIPALIRPKPQEKFIEMIPLGELDPGEGRPDSPDIDSGGSASSAPANQNISPPVPTPPVPVKATAPEPIPEPQVKEVPQTPPSPVRQEVSPVKKVEPIKPKPEPKKEAAVKSAESKPKVVPNLTNVVKKGSIGPSSSGAANSTSKTPGSNSGLSASEIESRLKGTLVGKGGNAGVEGGTGKGRLGDPNGIANAPWYDNYIGHQLKKNWTRPAASGPSIETWVSVRILKDGTVQYLRITKASGIPEMDQSVIDAVQSVKKLDTPPPAGLPNPYDRVVKFEL